MNSSSTDDPSPAIIAPKTFLRDALPICTSMNHYSHESPLTVCDSSSDRVDISSYRWSSFKRSSVSPPKLVRKYVDHSQDPLVVKKPKDCGEVAQRGAARQFPTKLYDMLSKASSDESEGGGFEDCVSWQPHGRCFIVRDPKEFVARIMPK